MPNQEESQTTDAAELQRILTRYVDSYDGYRQASEAVDAEWLKTAFLEISERRERIVQKVATLIQSQGEEPDTRGSAEAVLHRWWISLRAEMTDEELRAILEECVRGETVLATTIHSTLKGGNLNPNHVEILEKISVELHEALRTFRAALEH
jgi:uncharacterized protein (TIGR02284 family)